VAQRVYRSILTRKLKKAGKGMERPGPSDSRPRSRNPERYYNSKKPLGGRVFSGGKIFRIRGIVPFGSAYWPIKMPAAREGPGRQTETARGPPPQSGGRKSVWNVDQARSTDPYTDKSSIERGERIKWWEGWIGTEAYLMLKNKKVLAGEI